MRKDNWNIKFDTAGLFVNEIIDKIFLDRGIKDQYIFLQPSDRHINSPELFDRIDRAAQTLFDVMNNDGNILIYADVDTDGCCAAAIVHNYLRKIYNKEKLFIHINDGKVHGVTQEFLSTKFYYYNPDLIIVVDSINDTLDEYNEILQNNCQLIILDHHIPKSIICQNSKDLNLISSALNYPNPHLSGSGVAWRFVSYIDYVSNTSFAEEFIDLAAVGIVGDICDIGPDSMENRAICNLGFDYVVNPGLCAILGKDKITATDISFSLAPIINAANRLNKNLEAINLLITEDIGEVKKIAGNLKRYREKQKKDVALLYPEIEAQAYDQIDNPCLFFMMDKGPKEYTGLLATKLCAKFNRPCMVLHSGDTYYTGSMRAKGIDDFSMYINNSGLGESLGHENSAGMLIPKENLEALKEYLFTALADYEFKDDQVIDLKIYRSQLTPLLLDKVNRVNRISGQGFPAIRVLIENLQFYEIKGLKDNKHLSIELPDLKLVYWNFDHWEDVIDNGILSAIGTLEMNTFRGKAQPQILIEDYIFQVKENLW